MKLDQLEYFVATAQTQHVGKAARQLNVSPSAVSHSIRNLEQYLGEKLFEKTGKNIYLTEAGHRLATKVKGLLAHVEQIKQEFVSSDQPLEGQIRIGASHGLANLLVAPLIGKFQRQHPQLLFEIFSLRSAQVLAQAAAGELDIGICFSPNPHPNITVYQRLETSLKIAVKKNHPLRAKASNVARELSAFLAATPKAFSGIEVCENHPALRKANIIEKPGLIFDSYEVASEYLKQTDSWCLMPELLIKKLSLTTLPMSILDAQAHVAIIGRKGGLAPKTLIQYLSDGLSVF